MKSFKKILVLFSLLCLVFMVAAAPMPEVVPPDPESPLQELADLWNVVKALPGAVWLEALYLFVLVGVLKALNVIRDDGFAAASNLFFSIVMNGGLAGVSDLTLALQISATSALAAVYYLLWKNWLGNLFTRFFEWIKAKLPSKQPA